MKIYSYKRLGSALLCVGITIVAIIVQFLKGFSIELTGLSIILFFIALRDFGKSFSKESLKKDLIETLDERNQIIADRGDATAFKIVLNTVIALEIILIVLYGFLKEAMLLPTIVTLAVIVTLSFACSIVSNSYYEKRL